jgi:hypothetical protein
MRPGRTLPGMRKDEPIKAINTSSNNNRRQAGRRET